MALIARLVQALNAKLFERAWQLIAPADLVAHSCLFVMGSEGRGEQLLKTDQDNALVLRDGWQPPADLDVICQRFSDALARFGEELAALPEVLEAYLVSGEYDYLLRIAVHDTKDYERLLRERLYKIKGIRHSKSSFVLRVLKDEHVPL